jgi:hydroxyacylglutathione hydrolase
MIELQRKTLGSYQTNSYLLTHSVTNEAILIDTPAEAEAILAWTKPFDVKQIVLTHAHPDHIGALGEVRRSLDIPVALHPADVQDFNLEVERVLKHGDNIPLGDASLEIVHIPGHTQGSIALKIMDQGQFIFAIVGDAIFPGGPGHTASPSALRQSLDSLEQTVFIWPDHIELHPGHGDSTTVGDERGAFEAFRAKPLPPDLFGDVLWR